MALFGGVEIPGHPDLANCARLDLLPIPFIRRSARIGIGLNKESCAELSSKFAVELRELEKDITSYIPVERLREFSGPSEAGREVDEQQQEDDEIEPEWSASSFNAASSEQIGKLLFDMLGIGSGRKLKRTAKGAISTGKKQLELIKLEHPVVPKVLRHRELSKLRSTYTEKLPKLARFHNAGQSFGRTTSGPAPNLLIKADRCLACGLYHPSSHWRVHGEMGTTRAETGRINHKNPNLGNIPARTDDGQDVQRCFEAPDGNVLVARDLSQIELRDLAHLARCSSMIATYAANGDIHTETCYRTGLTPPGRKPTIAERMGAKRCSFGIQNGSTEKGLYLQLVMDFGAKKEAPPEWLTESWCKWFIGQWLDDRWEVRDLFEKCWYRARRYGLAWEPLGRTRLIPEVKSTHAYIREAGLRQAQNFPVTSFAAGKLKLGMGKADMLLTQLLDAGMWCWPLLCIHDSEMAEAAEDCAGEVDDALAWSLDTCMDDEQTREHRHLCPITSDGHVSKKWEK